jgi:MOSC domain-containing protein YiiM
MRHLSRDELEAGLDDIRAAPENDGVLELIVRRPAVGEREVVDDAELDVEVGLVGDTWLARGYRKSPDGAAHPGMQITLTNARAIALIADSRERMPLAGDQLYVDLDLSGDNLPPGTRLGIGGAVLEVTGEPHNGCAKFAERYGIEAVRFVNSPDGKALHLRGINSKVVEGGPIRRGDRIAVFRTSPAAG